MLVMKSVFLLATFLLFTGFRGVSPVSLTQEQSRLLEYHNHDRGLVSNCKVHGQPASKVPLKDLIWDNYLAKLARDLAVTCKYRHNNRELPTDKYRYIGQNIAGVPSVKMAMYEHNLSTYDLIKLMGDQIVWEDTKYVGCAAHDCTGAPSFPYNLYVVCNYAPGGNIIGRRPYEAKGGPCQGGGSGQIDTNNVDDFDNNLPVDKKPTGYDKYPDKGNEMATMAMNYPPDEVHVQYLTAQANQILTSNPDIDEVKIIISMNNQKKRTNHSHPEVTDIEPGFMKSRNNELAVINAVRD
ncbi:unnamed protein product [Trichobilharzia regenti]|nr:unnamed protein product [Trichobilharzia regenti]